MGHFKPPPTRKTMPHNGWNNWTRDWVRIELGTWMGLFQHNHTLTTLSALTVGRPLLFVPMVVAVHLISTTFPLPSRTRTQPMTFPLPAVPSRFLPEHRPPPTPSVFCFKPLLLATLSKTKISPAVKWAKEVVSTWPSNRPSDPTVHAIGHRLQLTDFGSKNS